MYRIDVPENHIHTQIHLEWKSKDNLLHVQRYADNITLINIAELYILAGGQWHTKFRPGRNDIEFREACMELLLEVVRRYPEDDIVFKLLNSRFNAGIKIGKEGTKSSIRRVLGISNYHSI